ncbi:MAG: ATP:cob(I)alamin adenosyltransferase, partial [Betaproteobacteria bacterium]
MGQRLTAIATRTGDDGSTGLGDGSRTSKDSLRVHAMGEVDELNSQLGVLRAPFGPSLKSAEPDALKGIDSLLHEIQHDLFDLGGELCMPGYEQLQAHHVLRLDEA